ncbi:MAG: hypothetical protein NC828_05290, partial [Candidatus Omnitrophica bacterium]|nr:hypothetical protein [Candidatus Omnitrophota bacterium]
MKKNNLKKNKSLPLRDRERQAIILILDLIGINVALFLSLSIRPEYGLNLDLLTKAPHWFLFFSFIWIV